MANLLTHIAREFKLDALTAFRKRWHAAKQAVSHSRALWIRRDKNDLRIGVFPGRLADPPEERTGVEISLRLRPTFRPGIGLTRLRGAAETDAYLYGALPFFGQFEVWAAGEQPSTTRSEARNYEVRIDGIGYPSNPDTGEDVYLTLRWGNWIWEPYVDPRRWLWNRKALVTDDRVLWGLVHNAKNTGPVAKPLWVVVMESVGCGSTYAQKLCRRFGRDPDEAVPGLMDDSGSCSVCGNTTCPECETVSDADYCRECFVMCEDCGEKVPREGAVIIDGDDEDTVWLCTQHALTSDPKRDPASEGALKAATPPPTFACGCTDEKRCTEHGPKVTELPVGPVATVNFESSLKPGEHWSLLHPVDTVCCARCGVNQSPDKAVQGPHGEVFCSDACATEALCGGGP